jgi:hypothetical protein
LYSTGTGGAATTLSGRSGLTACFAVFATGRAVKRFADLFTTRFTAALVLLLRRVADLLAVRRVVLVARIASALSLRFLIRRTLLASAARPLPLVWAAAYFLRWTMFLSVRLL